MSVAQARVRDIVYPEDRLPWVQMILMGFQHVMAMFGATVLVPIILGFDPNTVLFFSGVATLVFIALTQGKVPSYLGSSFSFIGPVLACKGNHELAYFGILVAGLIYLVLGVIVQIVGVNIIRFLFPPIVTGSVVFVVGLNLAPVAWSSYKGDLLTATVSLAVAILVSGYLRGFPRLLPILFGGIAGYILCAILTSTGAQCAAAKSACHLNFQPVLDASWIGLPKFSFPKPDASVIGLFIFVPIVLIAENTGHVFAISGIMKRDLSPYLGRTFMGDGLGTTISAFFGGTGETTYAENIGVMGVTRVFAIPIFIVAGLAAVVAGFIPKFGALINTIPISVIGGLEIYLFGLIAVIGGKIWVDGRVDFSKRANMAVAAIPLIIAAGVTGTETVGYGNFQLSGIGLGAITAILLYQVLRPAHLRDMEGDPEATMPPGETAPPPRGEPAPQH
jgi:putative pyrimidine permease RutG